MRSRSSSKMILLRQRGAMTEESPPVATTVQGVFNSALMRSMRPSSAPALHRYPGNMGRSLWSAAERLTSEYDGCAENIWGNVTAMEIVERLEAFSGISHKKASLACLLLWRDLGVEISDKENIDIAYDVHIRRIFLRAGFCEKDTLKDVTEAARRLNPKFPGYLTSPFWALGRNISRPTEPLCGQCPIRPFCARRLDKTENLRA